MNRLYRIQDADGRGPWRPGFSVQWIDPDKDDSLCPPMMVDFPDWREKMHKSAMKGLHNFGCCTRGVRGLHRWFTPTELDRLRGFGFHIVDASSLTVVAESNSQIIGASRLPLAYLPRIGWEIAA